MKGTLRAGAVSMKPAVVAGAALLACVVLAVAFDADWCVGVARRAVYGPPPEPVNVSLTVTPDGSVSINGERVRDGMATKTQVYDSAQTVSGVLAVRNQTYPGNRAPTYLWQIEAGGCTMGIQDITELGWSGPDPPPDPPADTAFIVVASINGWTGYSGTSRHQFYYIPSAGPYDLELPYSITVTGQRLTRTESTSYGTGRNGKPVYAKEVSETDAWETFRPLSWNLSFDDMSLSGTEVEGEPTPVSTPVTSLGLTIAQANGVAGVSYADVTIAWSVCPLDFSGMGKTVSPLRAVGDGNMISVGAVSNFTSPPAVWASHLMAIGRPYLKDFSAFAVVDRDGNLLPDLLVNGGFVADPRFPWTASCPTL